MKVDDSIFSTSDEAEMRNAKIMLIASSNDMDTSKSMFLPDVVGHLEWNCRQYGSIFKMR